MTFTAVGSLLQADATTFTLTPSAVGDFILFECINNGAGGVVATAMSSSNASWTFVGSNFTGVNYGATAQLFIGVATAASAATVTITWSGATPAGIRCAGWEFSSTNGFATLDVQGHIDTAVGTNTWASLTAALSGEMYFGYAVCGTAIAGSTTGYTYAIEVHGNGLAYNPSAGVSATAPVWGDSSQNLGIMALLQDVAGTNVFLGVLGPYLDTGITSSNGTNTFLNNNAWNASQAPGMTQVLTALPPVNPSVFTITANIPIPTGGSGEIISYPDIQQVYPEVPLSHWTSITSTWTEAMNSTASSVSWAAYDCWFNNFANEVLIAVDNHGISTAGDTDLGPVTIGGKLFERFHRPSSTEYLYVLQANTPSGSINLLGIFLDAQTNGFIPAGSLLNAIEFGWEISTTNSLSQVFSLSAFTITETFAAGTDMGAQHIRSAAAGSNRELGATHIGSNFE